MLIAGVIDHQLGDDADSAMVRLAQKRFEICKRAIARMDGGVIRDVISVIAQRRGIERQEPKRVDAEVLEVIELARQTLKITDAVGVRIEERLDVRLINNPVFVPEVIHSAACRVPRAVLQEILKVTLSPDLSANLKDMRRNDMRIQLNVVSRAVPCVAGARQKLVNLKGTIAVD